MQLIHSKPGARVVTHIDSRGDDVYALTIDTQRWTSSFWVDAEGVDAIALQDFDALEPSQLQLLLARQPEVVLLATGQRIKFPKAALRAAFLSRGIGLEVMTLAAAARTYNVLMSEQRKVLLLALFPDASE
jgi:uncharacterized protein